jgi:hypothetical protein
VIAFLATPLGLLLLAMAVIAGTLFLGETLRIVARLALVGLIALSIAYFAGWRPVVELVDNAPTEATRLAR